MIRFWSTVLLIIFIHNITFSKESPKNKPTQKETNKIILSKQEVKANKKTKVLTLDKCLSIVLSNSSKYKSYLYKIKAKEEKISEAKANLYYPDISVSLGYQYRGAEPKPFLPIAPHTLTSSLDINYLVYAFGRFGSLVSIAEQEYALSKLGREQIRSQIIQDVQKAYYGVLLAQQNIKILEDASNLLKQTLRDERRNYLKGRSAKSQYIRIQIQYENDRITLSKAKDDLVKAINVLFTLLPFKPIANIDDLEYEITGSFGIEKHFLKYSPLVEKLSDAIERAKKNRVELRELVIRKRILRLSKTTVSSAYKPTISIFGSVGLNYSKELSTSIGPSGPSFTLGKYKAVLNYSAGAKISIPLTDLIIPNSSSRSKIKSINYEIKGLSNSIDDIEKNLEQEVIAKHISFNKAKENLKTRQKIVNLSKQSFYIARRSYKAGSIDYLGYLDAYVQYRRSQFAYYGEIYNYNTAYLDLLRASGIYY